MTGVPITSVRVDKALNEIAENYSGGGGGGGMLVINGTMDEYERITLDKSREEIMQAFPNCIVKVDIPFVGQSVVLNASGSTSSTPMFLGFSPAINDGIISMVALIVTTSSVVVQNGTITLAGDA